MAQPKGICRHRMQATTTPSERQMLTTVAPAGVDLQWVALCVWLMGDALNAHHRSTPQPPISPRSSQHCRHTGGVQSSFCGVLDGGGPRVPAAHIERCTVDVGGNNGAALDK